MSKWKCRYCDEISYTDTVSVADGVCNLHPAGVGNHHFIRVNDSCIDKAKQFVQSENEKLPRLGRHRLDEAVYQLMVDFANAEHAERGKLLVKAAQNIVNTLERCEELRTIFLAKTPRSNLWQEVEQIVGAKNIIKEALAVHRSQNE